MEAKGQQNAEACFGVVPMVKQFRVDDNFADSARDGRRLGGRVAQTEAICPRRERRTEKLCQDLMQDGSCEES